MRSVLSKELRAVFNGWMAARLPSFKRNRRAIVPSGIHVYSCQVAPRLTLHLLLEVHPREDTFFVSAAFSEDGSIPTTVGAFPTDAPVNGGLCFRISHLWRRPGEEGGWCLVPPPSVFGPPEAWLAPPPPVEGLIEPLRAAVADATHRIEAHVLPYFRKVAAERGVSWDGKA